MPHRGRLAVVPLSAEPADVGPVTVSRRPIRPTRIAVAALTLLCVAQAGCSGPAHPVATTKWSSSTATGPQPSGPRPPGPTVSPPSATAGKPGGDATRPSGAAGTPGSGGSSGPTVTTNAPLVVGTSPPPTSGLDALYKGISVTSRSVSAIVHAPAGLPVTNLTEISVLFGDRRISQNYDPGAGTTIAFDYPVGDAARRGEMLTINLTEHAPGGAVPYHFYRLVTIEAQWEVVVSDLTFTLLNDCDLVTNSDPVVTIADDRGVVDVELSMSADQVRHLHQLSRFVPAATVSDGLVAPQVSFFEDDPGGFHTQPETPTTPPLLPGVSQHVHFDQADPGDAFCNAHFDYVIGIDLLTFHTP